jgi:hypothetical protein
VALGLVFLGAAYNRGERVIKNSGQISGHKENVTDRRGVLRFAVCLAARTINGHENDPFICSVEQASSAPDSTRPQ